MRCGRSTRRGLARLWHVLGSGRRSRWAATMRFTAEDAENAEMFGGEHRPRVGSVCRGRVGNLTRPETARSSALPSAVTPPALRPRRRYALAVGLRCAARAVRRYGASSARSGQGGRGLKARRHRPSASPLGPLLTHMAATLRPHPWCVGTSFKSESRILNAVRDHAAVAVPPSIQRFEERRAGSLGVRIRRGAGPDRLASHYTPTIHASH